MDLDLLVIGAGVAGLACARALTDAGRRPVVVERARGVGGRCATRRVDGQPVDHGVPFLHGRTAAFLAAVEAACGADLVRGWPVAVVGDGVPCRPAAFEPGSARSAPRAGVNAFPKALAAGLDVRCGAEVVALREVAGGARVEVATRDGATYAARRLVLATHLRATADLLAGMTPRPPAVAALAPLLGLVATAPCLAVIARYPEGTPAPAFDVAWPPDGPLTALVHDTAKRAPGARRVLVVQATAAWSRTHVEEAPSTWARALLDAAATRFGAWVATPDHVEPHAWRAARVVEGTELAAPLVATLAGGAVVGVCGDAFDARGGVEGAWHAGRALAARLGPGPSPAA